MFAALLSLSLAMVSVALAVPAVRAFLRGHRATGASAAGRAVSIVVPLVEGGDPGRSLARCLSAAAHDGPRSLRAASLAGDGLAERFADEVRRVDPGADVASLGIEASPRHVPTAWLAAAAVEACPGDLLVLADPSACPTARDASRLWSCAGTGGLSWAAGLPVPSSSGLSPVFTPATVVEDLAPLLAAACGPAALPPLMAAGPRSTVEAGIAQSLALHRPSLADSAARAAGPGAALVPVPVPLSPGRESEFANRWLRPLWRARPLGALWTLAALCASPLSLVTVWAAPGAARAVAVTALLLSLAARWAVTVPWLSATRGRGPAAALAPLVPLRDLAAAVLLLAEATAPRLRLGGARWQVRRDGVLAPRVPDR
jgi:hypothetical protein